MSAYVVYVRDRITDPIEFKKYEDSAPAASVGHPVTPLAFYGTVETLEGAPVDGAVILEFPTVADARSAYDSPLYQEALKHRLSGAEYRVFIIDGLARRRSVSMSAKHSKVWFITGAGRGFGRTWATAALQRGDAVAATASDLQALKPLVREFGSAVLPLQLEGELPNCRILLVGPE